MLEKTKDLVERFDKFGAEEINIPQKIEACIENRCVKLSEQSDELRDIEGKKQRLLWPIKDANEDFALEDCHRACERPLDVYQSWVQTASEAFSTRFALCITACPDYQNPS